MNTTKQITRTIKCWSRFGLFLGKNPREDWVRWPWGCRVKLVGPGIETCAPWPVFTWPNTSHCHAVQHQRGYDPCMPGFHPGNDGMAVTTNSGILDHSSSRNRPLRWRFFYLCIKEFRISFSCATVCIVLVASITGWLPHLQLIHMWCWHVLDPNNLCCPMSFCSILFCIFCSVRTMSLALLARY